MKSITNKAVIDYLLGKIAPEKEDDFLAECFSSDENAERFERARDRLIENYLRDDLSKEDKKLFKEHFLADPQNAEAFEFSKNLRGLLAKNKPLAVAASAGESAAKKSSAAGGWLVPVLAFGTLLLGAVFIWGIVSGKLVPEIAKVEPTPEPTAAPQISPLISASPTPLVNSSPAVNPTGTPKINIPVTPTPKVEPRNTVITFILPLIGKGNGKENVLKLDGAVESVRLETAKPFKEFPSYQVQIQKDGGAIWQGNFEKLPPRGEGRITVTVPAGNFKTGNHRFIVFGVNKDGTTEELKGTERSFEVEKKK